MARESIKKLSEEAAKQTAGVSNTRFFSEEFKRQREVMVLGWFVERYAKQGCVPELKFVEGYDDAYRKPDFTLFSQESDVQKASDIEVVGIQEQGRTRHDEYKSGRTEFDNPAPEPGYQDKFTSHVADELEKKLVKEYPPGSWLLVYFQPEKFIFYRLRPDGGRSFVEDVVSEALRDLPKPKGITKAWICPNPPADYAIRFDLVSRLGVGTAHAALVGFPNRSIASFS